jgi:branched-chain amino acid transport system ATP-binding protein
MPSAQRTRDGAPALELQGVGRRFGALRAVWDVSVTVSAGERRVILGPNGAGKTTLFNVVAGDFPLTAGRIFLSGREVTRMPAHRRTRLGLSRTYQNALLFEGLSVADNLYLAVRGKYRNRLSLVRPKAGHQHLERAAELAEHVGLADVMDVPPASLSHGQQRQLELGMALAGDPSLLMLDEPAAGLGTGERVHLAQLLARIPRDVSLLLIEHDVDLALQIADVVTVMHNGSVMEEGTPEQIQASQTVHDVYLGHRHAEE